LVYYWPSGTSVPAAFSFPPQQANFQFLKQGVVETPGHTV
jgi:hypothetical protein